MICPQCGSDNPADAFFCGGCGTNLRSALSQAPGPVQIGEPGAPAPPDAAGMPPEIASGALTPPGLDAPPAPPADVLDTPIRLTAPPPGSMEEIPPPPPPPGQSYTVPAEPYSSIPPSSPPPAPAQAPQGYGAPLAPGSSYQAPGGGYETPGGGFQTSTPQGYGQPGYGFTMPPDGNTSGMGAGYPLPHGVSGTNFGGCIPWGIFAFVNGSSLWGFIALGGLLFGPLGLAYAIYMLIQGREVAWRGRRFDSVEQFQDTMQAWNLWGIVFLGINAALAIVFVVLYIVLIVSAVSTGATGTGAGSGSGIFTP